MTTYSNGTQTFVGAGGTTTLTPAAGVTSATVNLTGLLTNWNISCQTGTTLTVNNAVAAGSNITLNTGGGAVTLTSSALSSGALGTVNATINGGSLSIGTNLINGNVIANGSVAFGALGGTEAVGTANTYATVNLLTMFAPLAGFTSNIDNVDDLSLRWTGSTSYTITSIDSGADRQVVITQGGNSFSFKVAGTTLSTGTFTSLTAGPLLLTQDATGGTNITVCFVRGTCIETVGGEAAIEDLQTGDLVTTRQGEETVYEPVRWIGQRRIAVHTYRQPEMVAPVRILQHAFAKDVPHRDLLVSPDHAIFTDGKLIAARQLVNDVTIRSEITEPYVDYFHIELDRHAILLAEGLLTESYLDTGNRGFFANSGEPLVLHPDLTGPSTTPDRELRSCAPFVWREEDVRPVWRSLAERAKTLQEPAPSPVTTTDPALRLRVNGNVLRPLTGTKDTYSFLIPAGVSDIHIISHAAAPTDTRPWMEDRRRLGVYVERIVLRDCGTMQTIPLDHPNLSLGWWSLEREGSALRRWTNGDALLPLRSKTREPSILDIKLASAQLEYLRDPENSRSAA